MPKFLLRIVALLLVPCLLTDPAVMASIGPVGAGFHPRPQSGIVPISNDIAGRHGGLPLQFPFTPQALAPAPVCAAHDILPDRPRLGALAGPLAMSWIWFPFLWLGSKTGVPPHKPVVVLAALGESLLLGYLGVSWHNAQASSWVLHHVFSWVSDPAARFFVQGLLPLVLLLLRSLFVDLVVFSVFHIGRLPYWEGDHIVWRRDDPARRVPGRERTTVSDRQSERGKQRQASKIFRVIYFLAEFILPARSGWLRALAPALIEWLVHVLSNFDARRTGKPLAMPSFFRKIFPPAPPEDPRGGFIIGPEVSDAELAQWLSDIDRGSEAVRDASEPVVAMVEEVCRRVDKDPRLMDLLASLHVSDMEYHRVMRKLKNPRKEFQWFHSVVRSREKYLLGYKSALAVDVLAYLKKAEERGLGRDLVVEYVMHEILENLDLSPSSKNQHARIIWITNRYFERLQYEKHRNTALGRQLRHFIDNESVIYQDLELIRKAKAAGRKKMELLVDKNGQIHEEGPLQIELVFEDEGSLRFEGTWSLTLRRRQLVRREAYSGNLPENLLEAIQRYNDEINPRSPGGFGRRELIFAATLMTSARPARWIRPMTRKPALLPNLLLHLEAESKSAFQSAMIALVGAYQGKSAETLDAVLLALERTRPENLTTLLRMVEEAADSWLISGGPHDLLDYAINLERTLRILIKGPISMVSPWDRRAA